ncbi:hypothetical protein JCM10908_001652 [Rhodotorula pacifica]|uniref:uncharacterized protein n=1 Tax=Rhodotorula pacifica TaxID=1495444 RepID=UPI00317A320A
MPLASTQPNHHVVESSGRGILGRKGSDASSKSSHSKGSVPSGLVAASGAAWQAESRSTLSSGLSAPKEALAACDNSFDRLLVSNETIKLSFTPETLKEPATASPACPDVFATTPSPKRLRPRAPRPRGPLAAIEDETTEDSDVSAADEYKAALIEVINSAPPWETTPTKPKLAIVQPASHIQEVDESPTAVSQAASTDGVPHWREKPDREIAARRLPAVRAKDQQRDWASERQINHDLMEFFATPPPSAPSRPTAYGNSRSPSAQHRKSLSSSPNLQRLVERVTTAPYKADWGPARPDSVSRSSSDFAAEDGHRINAPLRSPTASHSPRLYNDASSRSTYRASSEGSVRGRKTGFALPPGLAEDVSAEVTPLSSTHERIRFVRTTSRPHSIAHREEPPQSILRTAAPQLARTATDPGVQSHAGSQSVPIVASPTPPFETALRSPQPSQHSRTGSTASSPSLSTSLSPQRGQTSRTQAMIVAPIAIGSALAVETSSAPVTFEHRNRKRASASSTTSAKSKQSTALVPAQSPSSSPRLPQSSRRARSASTTESQAPDASYATPHLSPFLLLQLRTSMLGAKSRDDCIAMIDEALRNSVPTSGDTSGTSLAHVAEFLLNTADGSLR